MRRKGRNPSDKRCGTTKARIWTYRNLGGRFRKRGSRVLEPVHVRVGWMEEVVLLGGGWLTDYALARNSVLNGLAVGCRGNVSDHHFSPKRRAYAGPSLHSAIIGAFGRRWGPLRMREESTKGEGKKATRSLVCVVGKEGRRKDRGFAMRLVLDEIFLWRCS